MSYRPDNWKNPNRGYDSDADRVDRLMHDNYEKGADAMLEAIFESYKEQSFRLDMESLGCGFTKDTKAELEPIGWWAYEQVANSKLGQGHLIFIPDDD